MSIRVELEPTGCWVEFKEAGWTFGDRMKIVQAETDFDAIRLILKYVEAWNIKDVDGNDVSLDGGFDALMNVDDVTVVSFIKSWFIARERRRTVPKAI